MTHLFADGVVSLTKNERWFCVDKTGVSTLSWRKELLYYVVCVVVVSCGLVCGLVCGFSVSQTTPRLFCACIVVLAITLFFAGDPDCGTVRVSAGAINCLAVLDRLGPKGKRRTFAKRKKAPKMVDLSWQRTDRRALLTFLG